MWIDICGPLYQHSVHSVWLIIQSIWEKKHTNRPRSSNVVLSILPAPQARTIRDTGVEVTREAEVTSIHKGKQIKSNTKHWMWPSPVRVSQAGTRRPLSLWPSRRSLVLPFGAAGRCWWRLILLSPLTAPLLGFVLQTEKSLKEPHPRHSYFIFIFHCIIFLHIVWLPHITFFPQNYFWVSCSYIVQISAYVPKK